jgi:G:T-mismatch repair DNA endonuclease (very short patch repair protein)
MKLRSSCFIAKETLTGDPPLLCPLMNIIIFVLGCFSVEMMEQK